MPFIDRIIQFLRTHHGDRIVLESDQNVVIYRAGGAAAPTQDRLTFAQIDNLVTEVLPEDKRPLYHSGEPVMFEYAANGAPVQVEVSQVEGNLRVSIGIAEPREETAPPPPVAAAVHEQPPAVHTGELKKVRHIDDLLRYLKQVEASDLHLSSNQPPFVRIHGTMKKLAEYEVTTPERAKKLLWEIVPKRNQDEWERDHDTDFSYELPGVARFRCNIFCDRHGPGGVFRLIPSQIQTVEELDLPRQLLDLCYLSKGLVLVTGPTGSGKTTTLAALVDYINKNRDDHIVTIEDPVEFVHENIRCLVNQREVHVHTNSFARALRAALREDPDIVMVGEMRDLETMAIAIETAETGHLVFGTLHTSTAASTVDRVIDQFPAEQQEQIRVMLSETLKAVIAQGLNRSTDGRRVASWEILLIDPACANLIRENKTYQLPSMMQIGKARGCITMNDSLLGLVKAGRVTPKEAYIKSVDKVGLLGGFEKEGIKLDLSAPA